MFLFYVFVIYFFFYLIEVLFQLTEMLFNRMFFFSFIIKL